MLPLLLPQLQAFTVSLKKVSVELVLVDDGSCDETGNQLLAFADALGAERCQVVTLAGNHGQQAAIAAGLDICRGDVAVVIDADLQTPLSTIPEMLAVYQEGNDIVHAQRRARGAGERLKALAAGAFYWFAIYGLGARLVYGSPDFKLLSRRVIEVVKQYGEDRRFFRGLVASLSLPQAVVPYVATSRERGKSKYSWRLMWCLALTGCGAMQGGVARLCMVMTLMIDLVLGGLWCLGRVSTGELAVGLLLCLQAILLLVVLPYVLHNNRLLRKRPLYVIDEARSRVA